MTHFWKRVLSITQTVGIRKAKVELTRSLTCHILRETVSDFGVTFNDVKDAAFYTTTSRFVSWLGAFSQERQELWLPKDDLRDSSSWSSSSIMILRDIHSKLLNQFDFKEVCVSSPSQVNAGASGGLSSQDGVPASLSSPHIIGSPNRYSVTGRPSRISNLCLWARVARNS